MPDEVKHTPLPWVPCYENGTAIHGATGEQVLRTSAGLFTPDKAARMEANAALIVRAVNAHAELLALCKEAEHLMPYIPAESFDGHAADFFRRLSAAIKKAEGAA